VGALIQINAFAWGSALTARGMLAWFVSVMIVNLILAAASGANWSRKNWRAIPSVGR
jgi:hypothetical protein